MIGLEAIVVATENGVAETTDTRLMAKEVALVVATVETGVGGEDVAVAAVDSRSTGVWTMSTMATATADLTAIRMHSTNIAVYVTALGA